MFAAGQYAPQSTEGRWLLAHELTHTLQQNSTTRSPHAEPHPVVQGIHSPPMPTRRAVQRDPDPESTEAQFSGAEGEFTWEKDIGKQLTFRFQGEILYNSASGPAKLSKGILKLTKKSGKGLTAALAGRMATLDPLSTSLADEFFALLGEHGEMIRDHVGLEIKLAELELKNGKPDFSLLKVELKIPRMDITNLIASVSPGFKEALDDLKADGHDLRVRAHLGIQWKVPIEAVLKRNPYVLAALAGAAAGGGLTYLMVKTYMGAIGEAGGALLEAGTAAESVGEGLAQGFEAAIYRPAFEVLVMADPENMEFDAEVSEEAIGVITELGLEIQTKIWTSSEIADAIKSAVQVPMSQFASIADMEEVALAGRTIGSLDDHSLNPSTLLKLTPKAFLQRLWDADILSWTRDPGFDLAEIEQDFIRGKWKPTVAG